MQAPPRRVDSGAAQRTLDAFVELTRELAMSVLDRIVDATRHDVAQRRREVPVAELEQAIAGAGRTGRSPRR